jgi:hypothetical protein
LTTSDQAAALRHAEAIWRQAPPFTGNTLQVAPRTANNRIRLMIVPALWSDRAGAVPDLGDLRVKARAVDTTVTCADRRQDIPRCVIDRGQAWRAPDRPFGAAWAA